MSVGFTSLGFGVNASATPVAGPSYDTDAAAHFARMTETNVDLLGDLNDLIVGLKADGIWTKLDVLCVAKTLEADSLLNLVSSSYDATNVNSCSFTADQGFTTDRASSKYIDSNYTPSAGANWGATDHCLFHYQRSCESVVSEWIGAKDAFPNWAVLHMDPSASPDSNSLISGAINSVNISENTPTGFIGGTRTASNACEFRINGTSASTSNTGSAAPTIDMFIGGSNSSGSPSSMVNNQFAAWGFGGGLTTTELANLRTRIQAYFTARGTAV